MPPDEQPAPSGFFGSRVASVTAQLSRRKLPFAVRFDETVTRLLADPLAGGIAPGETQRFFGLGLQIAVDPARLRWRLSDYVEDHRGVHYIGDSFLDAADWSGAVARVERSPVHREMAQLVAADLNFREIPAYRNLLLRAQAGRPVTRNGICLESREQIDSYFQYCRDLALSIRERGILPRRDLRGHIWASLTRRGRPLSWEASERDIGVAIGAKGRLIRHIGGKHRTAIAQALKLPLVPVEVRLVHVAWLTRQMKRRSLPAHRALPAALAELSDAKVGRSDAAATS